MSELHTRKEKRTPVTLKIKFKSATLDQFIERYSVDVSQGGIFIRTKDPLGVGTQLRFEFQLQDASPLISGEGTVVWTREFDPSRTGVAPGMGVRFDRLAPESQGVLEQILLRKSGGAKPAVPDSLETPAVTLTDKTRITPQNMVQSLASQSRPSSPQPPVHVDKPILPAVSRGLTGLVPSRGGFADEPKDQTPLPKPMPFHVGGDEEFNEDVFEQPTKVASLELLLKHEEEQARAAQAEAARQAAVSAAALARAAAQELEEDEQTAVTLNRAVRPLPDAVIVPAPPEPAPPPVAARPARTTPTNVPQAVPTQIGTEPAFIQNLGTRSPSGERRAASGVRPAVTLPERRTSSPSGERKPISSPAIPTSSSSSSSIPAGRSPKSSPSSPRVSPASTSSSPISASTPPVRGGTPAPSLVIEKHSMTPYILGAGVILAAAAALWLFVIQGHDSPPTRPQLVKKVPPPDEPPPTAPSAVVVPPAPAKKVSVPVSSTPVGAHVTLDGAPRGQTPTTLDDLEAGKRYEVALSAACYRTEKVALAPTAENSGKVDQKLTPLERVVHVKSDPPGAIVLVDGKPAGRTPADVRLVGKLDPRAPHTFVLRRPGFEDTPTTLSPDSPCATEGDTAALGLSVSLTPLRKAAPDPAPAKPAPTPAKPVPAKVAPPEPSPVKSEPSPTPAKPEDSKAEPVTAPKIEQELPSKPVESAPPPPPAPKPEPSAKPVPGDKAEKGEKKDCDPSPDAPEWARCK